MGIKDVASSIVRGLERMNDNSSRRRISEIDQEIYDLKQERNYLIYNLTNPREDEKPDADFDVRSYRPKPKAIEFELSEGGRIVDCPGRKIGEMSYVAHPDCPHKHEKHIAHDFYLKY